MGKVMRTFSISMAHLTYAPVRHFLYNGPFQCTCLSLRNLMKGSF